MTDVDLAIIGSGPAGMSAAMAAADAGLSVVVLDEQQQPGGQIYRNVGNISSDRDNILGESYVKGRQLVKAFTLCAANYIPGAVVWAIKAKHGDEDCKITYSVNNQAMQLSASRLIVATGALERSVPVPGWTLPGVLTAGAGQIMLKQSSLVAKRSVIAGSGPLVLLLAQQMIRAGSPPLAVVETQSRQDMIKSFSHLGGALKGWRYLKQGVQMLREINRAGVKRYTGASQIKLKGNSQVEKISFVCGGDLQSIDCNIVFLHQGVIPNTQITRSLNIEHVWDQRQHCFKPNVNGWQQTSINQVYITGDGAGIAGAGAAELTGKIAALHAVASVQDRSIQERDAQASKLRKALQHELAIRPFLDIAYPVPEKILRPSDEVIICRCEEITAGDIRRYTQLGCIGPNQTKAFGRCGMGPCQGRYCGLNVTELLARENTMHHNEVGYYRIRQPLKPITVGELASLENSND